MRDKCRWFFRYFLPKLPLFFIFLPFVILMRCLRPILWIRFFPISDRIGHAAGDIDIYLLEKNKGIQHSNGIEIFFPKHPSKCNQQLLKLWGRIIPVSRLAHWVSWVNNEIPGGKAHYNEGRPHQGRDIHGLSYKNPPQVSFTLSEQEQGEVLLREMGIPKDASFICVDVRDSLYLKHHIPGGDCSYHDYRDYSVENFVPAAKELIQRDYYVIRMGRLVEKDFPIRDPKIIDYANSPFRSDFADMYLISKCHFFVGSGGIESVARLFRKPIVYVDMIPVGRLHTWSENFLAIFKFLRDKKANRILKFRDMLVKDIGYASYTKEYEDRNFEVIENSPEDIRDVVLEMEERLKGKWVCTEKQEELQGRYWKEYPLAVGLHGANKSRIGSLFLEKYEDLF